MKNTAKDYSDELNTARNAGQPSPANFRVPRAADNYNPVRHADNYTRNDVNNQAEELESVRKNEKLGIGQKLDQAKKMAKIATPLGALSLTKYIKPLADMPYVAAIGAAMLKDLLDFVTGPTVALAIIFSILCSIFIFMMMLLVGATGKKKGARKFAKKIFVLIGGGIADSIPVLNFFPIETLTVAIIYFLELVDRKSAGK